MLDGELVVLDDVGRPRFELIQRHEREAALYVFDVLSIDGHDTIAEPYEERRRLLGEVLGRRLQLGRAGPPHRRRRRPCSTRPVAQELEGVMAKRLGTTYRPGARSKDWRKVKNRRRAEVVIGGYTPGTGNRSSSFGALLVGRYVDGVLAFAGGVGTGFTQRRLDEHDGAAAGAAHRRVPVRPAPADGLPPRARRGSSRCCGRPSRSPSSPTTATSARPASSTSCDGADDDAASDGARRSTPPIRWRRGGTGS